MNNFIITIDGPAGAGKSSVAKRLAQNLGAFFLDTGAMYRAVVAAALDQNIDIQNQSEDVVKLVENNPLRINFDKDKTQIFVGKNDVTKFLRDEKVTASVSAVAALPQIREILVKAQQRIGKQNPKIVTEGRDQGSVVFPDATVKFYLDASADIRAKRRKQQLERAGEQVDLNQIKESIIQRDKKDKQRKISPLIQPEDALYIDTSDMTCRQVIDLLTTKVVEFTQ